MSISTPPSRDWRSHAACRDTDPEPIDRTTAAFTCVFGVLEVVWPVRVVRPEGGCMTFDELDRDVRSLRLSGWGRVAASSGVVLVLCLERWRAGVSASLLGGSRNP